MKNIHVLPTDKPSRIGYYTDQKDTQLYILGNGNKIGSYKPNWKPQHIYITFSDEEIKEGDLYYNIARGRIYRYINQDRINDDNWQKIILTTDPGLIKYGVQAIDDEFLEWFVKNPSCDYVETRYSYPTIDYEGDGSISEGYWLLVIPKENKIYRECPNGCRGKLSYLTKDECLCSCGTKWNIKTNKIITPKEEPKQETLEEDLRQLFKNNFDCYADVDSDNVIMAMTEDCFIETFKEWQQQQNKNLYSEEEVNNIFKLVLQTNNIETLNVYADGKIEVNGVLTTDNDLIVETLKRIAKKQII